MAKLDAVTTELERAGDVAGAIEAQGFDGLNFFESSHDAFVPLALAATRTTRIELMTGGAIAFARNPMVCAYLANDLQLVSRGRFVLGLGTQIRWSTCCVPSRRGDEPRAGA